MITLRPGDKVCYKHAPSRIATVRPEKYHEDIVLLEWPFGAIGSASIDDLMLVSAREDRPLLDNNPNVSFRNRKEPTYIPYSARTNKSKAFIK